MAEKTLKPAIRFKGFTNAWEQHSLKELGNFKSNGVDKLSKPNEIPVNLLNYMDVYNRREITNYNVHELMQVTAKPTQLVENNVIKNDIFFTPTSETPDDIGRVYVVEESLDNTVYSYHLMRFRPHDGVYYPNFPNYSLMTDKVRKQFYLSAKGVQRYVISKSDFESIEDILPEYNEQAKIGELFRSLDQLITLHQRKYDKLVNIKKSLLHTMFPSDGENVPKVRFKGFTNAWELRLAKDLVSITTGKSNTQDQIDEGKYPFFIRSETPVRSDKYLYDEEAVLTIGDGQIGRVFHYINGKFDLHQRVYKMADFSEIDAKYFYYFFSTKFYDRAMKMTAKATVDSVRLEMISEMEILKPSNQSEQQKIASLFSSIDNLITLHQRKLEKLKNIKKSLLNRMFI